MAAICNMCSKVAKNEDIFFDVSSSTTGLETKNIYGAYDRADGIVCILCVPQYITNNTFKKINLIRRIDKPYSSR